MFYQASNGLPLTQWGAPMLFKRLKKRTGIDGKRVFVHQSRRYMATTQLAMGHSTLIMKNPYVSLNIQQLQRSHEKYSPLRAEKSSTKMCLVRVIEVSSRMPT